MARAANGESSIYEGADGRWHGWVWMGTRENGQADRRHVTGKKRSVVVAKVRDLERKRDAGITPKIGERDTVAVWLRHWLYNIAAPADGRGVRPKTYLAYRGDVERHLIPRIGHHRLTKLDAEHVEHLHADLLASGLSAKSVLNAHRTLSRALRVAMARGKVQRNVATLVTPPQPLRKEIEPLTADEARAVLVVSRARRNAARWSVALGCGLRQGEALGLGWKDIDLDAGVVRVRWQLQRLPYEHGCAPRGSDPACGGRPMRCPDRRGGLVFSRPKSKAGERDLTLPAPLVEELRAHRAVQLEERLRAGALWQEGPRGGLVFAQPSGKPIDARRDYDEWLAILTEAKVTRARLHDARHSCATLLLERGIDIKVVSEILGHTQTWFTRDTYQHVTKKLQDEAAEQMSGALWG
jgi:integrase